MENSKIIQALKPLDIPVYYLKNTQSNDKYIIFSIYNNKDTDHAENTNLGERSYITLKYYYTNPSDLYLYKEIKKIMKNNGFGFDGGEDLGIEGNLYGKELDFILDITTQEE